MKVIDLFCGIGGLTHGFVKENIDVIAGIDIDNTCKYMYEKNNNSKFICKDIDLINKEEIEELFGETKVKILVGCAPCQPFSTYSFKREESEKWYLLYKFAKLIEEIQPEIISMENVPRLVSFKKAPVFQDFIDVLEKNGYKYSYEIVNCPDYGIPQNRKRLVLLASKLGEIKLIPKTHTNKYVTVKDAISHLEPLLHGESSCKDPVHRAAKLTPINLKRIKQSLPGKSWRDWDEDLKLECHKKDSGKSYVSVYGRMTWNNPSPTITTHCLGFGNGRFGHPEQDRAISLREASILQTFPEDYIFFENIETFNVKQTATHIGNAVPVLLGQIIAKSIKKHLEEL